MANKYLAREDAPFGPEIWEMLDGAMQKAARAELVGRRLLPLEGPLGLGVKAVPLRDKEVKPGLWSSEMLPIQWIHQRFELGARDLAGFERDGIPFDTRPVTEAATACARQEDQVVLYGEGGTPGLLTIEGVSRQALSAWEEVGEAANDAIQAVGKLDDAGFYGPYTLALAPKRYNQLYRLYQTGNRSELDHIKTIVTEGVYKAPALEAGGVLLASGRRPAFIVIGQDMSIGFIGPAGETLEFSISESLAVNILRPQGICVLE